MPCGPPNLWEATAALVMPVPGQPPSAKLTGRPAAAWTASMCREIPSSRAVALRFSMLLTLPTSALARPTATSVVSAVRNSAAAVSRTRPDASTGR